MNNTIITSISALVFLVIGLFIGKSNKQIEIQTVVKTNIIEKPVDKIVEKIIEKPVVQYVDKYITNVVEKIVESEIPKDYAIAYSIVKNQMNAKFLPFDKIPKGVTKVSVNSYISDEIKTIVSKEAFNNLMEFELRKIGIAIDKTADYNLIYSIDAFWNDNKTQIIYSKKLSLSKTSFIYSDGEHYRTLSEVFSEKFFGFGGKNKADQKQFNDDLSESMITLCNKILESKEK